MVNKQKQKVTRSVKVVNLPLFYRVLILLQTFLLLIVIFNLILLYDAVKDLQ